MLFIHVKLYVLDEKQRNSTKCFDPLSCKAMSSAVRQIRQVNIHSTVEGISTHVSLVSNLIDNRIC